MTTQDVAPKFNSKSYMLLTVVAILAALFNGTGTYDLSIHFSPPFISLFSIDIPREMIGALSIALVDGIYILLDFMLPKLRTHNARTSALLFMVVLWGVMVSANLASAVINNSMNTAALGGFSWVIYGVKLGALIYLAWYTYVRWDDPATKYEIIEVDLVSAMQDKINAAQKKYNGLIGANAGDTIALVRSLDAYKTEFEKQTGKDVRLALGDNWRRAVAKQSGIVIPTGFVFDDEKAASPVEDDDITEPPATGGTKAKRKKDESPVEAIAPVEKTVPVKPEGMIPNLLNSLTSKLTSKSTGEATNPQ